jgi:hypothetical protein
MNVRLRDEYRILNASRLVFWVLTASKMVSHCQTTRRHIPENSDLHIQTVRNSKLTGTTMFWHYQEQSSYGKNMGPKLCGSGWDGVFHVPREGLKETEQEGL